MFKYRVLFLIGVLIGTFIMYMAMLFLHQIILDSNFLSFNFVFIIVFIAFLLCSIHLNFDYYSECKKYYKFKRDGF